MTYGRIIVEGLTDAYFIHQVLVKRFAEFVSPEYENGKGHSYPVEKDEPDETFAFRGREADFRLEIRTNGGSSKLDVLRGLLRDESGLDREFRAVVIFDADYPAREGRDATGNGGFKKACEDFTRFLSTCVGTTPGTLKEPAGLFLFPNHGDDGTVETLLRPMANEIHSQYFDSCWPKFVEEVKASGAKRVLSDKTELADYVEAYGKRISEKKCYLRNLTNDEIWDYQHSSLERLVRFLKSFIKALIPNGRTG